LGVETEKETAVKYDDLFDPNRTGWTLLADNPILLAMVGLVASYLVVKVLAAILKAGGRK